MIDWNLIEFIFILAILIMVGFIFYVLISVILGLRKLGETSKKEVKDKEPEEEPFIQELIKDFSNTSEARNYIYLDETKINNLFSQIQPDKVSSLSKEGVTSSKSEVDVGIGVNSTKIGTSNEYKSTLKAREERTYEYSSSLQCNIAISTLIATDKIHLGLDVFERKYDASKLDTFLFYCNNMDKIGFKPPKKWFESCITKIKREPKLFLDKIRDSFQEVERSNFKYVLMRNEFNITQEDEKILLLRKPKYNETEEKDVASLPSIEVHINNNNLTSDGKQIIQLGDSIFITMFGTGYCQGHRFHVIPIGIIR